MIWCSLTLERDQSSLNNDQRYIKVMIYDRKPLKSTEKVQECGACGLFALGFLLDDCLYKVFAS